MRFLAEAHGLRVFQGPSGGGTMGTVEGDLHRHLVQQDADDARAEEADRVIDEWMLDPEEVVDALESMGVDLPEDCDDSELLRIAQDHAAELADHWFDAACEEADRRYREAKGEAEIARWEAREADRDS